MSTLDPSAISPLYSDHNSWPKGWLRVRPGPSVDAADLAHNTVLKPLGVSGATVRNHLIRATTRCLLLVDTP